MTTSGYPGGGGICLYGIQVDGRVEAMCALRDGHEDEHRLMDRKGRWLADSILDDILDQGALRRGAPFGVIRHLEIEP